MNAVAWRVTLAAALMLALSGGLRSVQGLFVAPLDAATGLGLAAISLLFANGQLAHGLAQPALGAFADRHGAARLISLGAVALAAATAWPALSAAPAGVAISLVLAAVAAAAVGSNAVLIGEVSRRVGASRAGLATGIVGAGGPLGHLVVGPLTQHWIDARGWRFALAASAALVLLALPLALLMRRRGVAAGARREAPPLAATLRDLRFWIVTASFAACGFHVGFLGVHMPGVIDRCGLPPSLAGTWIAVAGVANALGSVAAGQALQRVDAGRLLATVYFVRVAGIAAWLAVAPTSTALLAFALVMGASHMATLPPTAALIARDHGAERLAGLLGVVMLVHQIGGFAGVWLGGALAQRARSDAALWCIDIALALGAAALAWARRAPTAAAGATTSSAWARS